MKVLFENEQEKEWNKLNKNSVKFRLSDLEQIEKMENVTFLDENDKKISDAEIYLPPSKAYIIINRVHFGEAGRVFDGDKEAILKRMISYFLYPKNLKYFSFKACFWISKQCLLYLSITSKTIYPFGLVIEIIFLTTL